MKYDLSIALMTYDGKPFTRSVIGEDGQPIIVAGKVQQEPLILQQALEAACLGADPQEYGTSDKKMIVFNLLMKIHGANPSVDLTAEEVSTLKNLVGKQMSVGAVGVIFRHLEKNRINEPVT